MTEKKQKKKSNLLINILIVILLGVLCFCGYKLAGELQSMQAAKKDKAYIQEIIDSVDDGGDVEDAPRFTQKMYDSLKAENEDFYAYLMFDSDMIKTPLMYSTVDQKYLRLGFDGQYNSQGVPFYDVFSTKDSKNQMIYGHMVYYDETAQFSPLEKLTTQEGYDANNTFSIYYEDGEVRNYVVTNVYRYNEINDSAYDFTQSFWPTEEDFDEWYSFACNRNLITATDTLTYEDNFVTFQTCKKWEEDGRWIVVAKEVSRSAY